MKLADVEVADSRAMYIPAQYADSRLPEPKNNISIKSTERYRNTEET
jgi:hypothetical protein